MKNQSPLHELAIIPYNHQNILPPNIVNQPPKPDNTTRDNRQNIVCSNLLDEFHRRYNTQELLATIFIRIMSVTSFTHLILGLHLLDETGLSASISPIVMSLFKYSMAIFTSVSLASVGDIYSRLFEAPKFTRTRLLGMCFVFTLVNSLSPIAQIYKRIVNYIADFTYMAIRGDFRSTGLGKHRRILHVGLYWFMQTIVFPIMVRVNTSSDLLVVVSALAVTFWAAKSSIGLLASCAPSLHCFLDTSVQKFLPLATARVKSSLKNKKMWKFVKYAIGLVGTLIFQNFFRLTTFVHVKAFMYLATSWLANLALINASDDFGILNFLLGNMILGSTVSQYGLESTTWFTYGVCLFLYMLRIKLKSMKKNSQNIESLERPPFLFWIFYCCVVLDSLFNLFHQI